MTLPIMGSALKKQHYWKTVFNQIISAIEIKLLNKSSQKAIALKTGTS